MSPVLECSFSQRRSLSSLFSASVHLHRGSTGSWHHLGEVIAGWAQLRVSGPSWPSVTLGFDDRLDLLCSVPLSRWEHGGMTMAGNIKAREARDGLQVIGQAGQLSDECSCGHMDLLFCLQALLAMSADVAFVLYKDLTNSKQLVEGNKHRQQMYCATDSVLS